MRIYLAARWSRMSELSKYAALLRKDGHTITARWVDNAENGLTRACNALMDYGDVAAADVVLSFTEPYRSENAGGGRHTEFGIGYVLGKRCMLVGELEQIFHYLPGVYQFDTFDQARQALREYVQMSLERPREPIARVLQNTPAAAPSVRRLLTGKTSAERKEYPITTGVLDYFPDAIAMVAHVSYVGNQKHNPGQPLHWARGKSMDHEDCIARHTIERDQEEDGILHAANRAWRALAELQQMLEVKYDLSPPRNAR